MLRCHPSYNLIKYQLCLKEETMTHTHIATIKGIRCFEHETHGDEHPILFKLRDQFLSSGLYDLLDHDEVVDAYNNVKGEMDND